TASFDNGLESLTFANPTAALVVNGHAGDDAITFTSLDSGFNAALSVDGGAGTDTVSLNTALTLGSGSSSGNVSVTAENVNVNSPITTTAGSTGAVTFNVSSQLSIAAGADI